MKKLLLIALMAFSTFSYSQERQKPVACYQLNEMLDNLKTNYGEKLDFVITNHMYREFVTKIAFYRNEHTGSWTIIEYGENFEGEGCILGSGKESTS
jgi:hypothetical protein